MTFFSVNFFISSFCFCRFYFDFIFIFTKFSVLKLSRLLHLTLQRFVSAFVVRMFVLLVLDDSQNFVGRENGAAFVTATESTLPNDSVGNVLDAVVNETVLCENVQLQPAFVIVSSFSR